jgi:hypothetical protein
MISNNRGAVKFKIIIGLLIGLVVGLAANACCPVKKLRIVS